MKEPFDGGGKNVPPSRAKSAPGASDGRSRPCFPGGIHQAENACRWYYDFDTAHHGDEKAPVRRTPAWWLNGGMGWSTTFFTDLEPFDVEAKQPGVHRCLVPVAAGRPCKFVVAGGEAFVFKRWFPLGRGPEAMCQHLHEAHDLSQPPKRGWAESLNGDTVVCMGCWDALCCWGCQLGRQYAALHGYRDTPARCPTVCFGCCCPCCAARQLRVAVVALHNIDEAPMATTACAFCCLPCSICTTYREFAAAGLWPGGSCCCSRYEPQMALGPTVVVTAPPKAGQSIK